MATIGVRGGLSVDHLVVAGQGASFSQLGGPGLFAALGARLVDGVSVRVSTRLPDDEPRFAELFDRLHIDRQYCAPVPTATRLWILNSAQGRRIVETASPGPVELETAAADSDEDDSEQPAAPGFFAGLDALLDSSPIRRPDVGGMTAVGIDPHQVPMHKDGIEYLRRVTPAGGIVLPSRVQLSLIDTDAHAAARRIATVLGVPVIARLDREGILVVDAGDTHEWTVRDANVHVVETTGAGDSSAAAIMAATALGADPVNAAMFGVAVARHALARWGAAALLEATPLTSPPNGVTAKQEK